MAAEIDFQPYLQSISTHYEQWWRFYTLTDAETQAQQRNELQPWKTPFDFGLMVQTVQRDRSLGSDGLEYEAQSSKEKIERFPVLEGIRKFVKEHRQVLLVGRPGSGKSTTLARLLLEEACRCSAINQSSNPLLGGAGGGLVSGAIDRPTPPFGHPSEEGIGDGTCIPVLVELRFLSNSTLLDRIQAFFQRHDLPLDRTQIEDLLFHRRLLLLMDGLNELPSEAARLDVAKFRQDYPKVSMIFTTRDLSLGGDFGLEKKLEMQPLTEAQMQAFVRSYVPEQAEAMLRQLKDRLREFGQTPLLLWMLCDLFRQTGQIPANLGEVFRAFTQGYEKHLKADVPVESDRRWWSELLQELAFWMMRGVPFGEEAPAVDVEFRVAISKVEARKIFTTFLQNKEAQAKGVAQKYLDDLLRHHLIQLNGEQVEFPHQLLQEYYAAEYLLKQLEAIGDFELQQQYLNYLKWTESVSLMLSLTEAQESAARVIKLSLDVDYILSGRLAGSIKPKFQDNIFNILHVSKIPEWLKIEIFGRSKLHLAVSYLLGNLKHQNHLIRRRSVEALGRIGEISILSGLSKTITDQDSEVRMSTVNALESLNSEEVIPFLIKAVQNSTWDGRRASGVLSKLNTEKYIDDLLDILINANTYNKSNISFVVGSTIKEKYLPKVLNLLDDPREEIRERVIYALSYTRSTLPVSKLLNLLEKDSSILIRKESAYSLGRIGFEGSIPKLKESMTDFSAEVRAAIVSALQQIASREGVPILLSATQDIDNRVRERAIEALSIAPNDTEVIETLIKCLEDIDTHVQYTAALTLGKVKAVRAAPKIITLLNQENSEVRACAAYSLGSIRSLVAVESLLHKLNDESGKVRRYAAQALGLIASEQAIQGLTDSTKSQNAASSISFNLLTGDSVDILPGLFGLIKATENTNKSVYLSAAHALKENCSENTILCLLDSVDATDGATCLGASVALSLMDLEIVIPRLIKALRDNDGIISRQAFKALKSIVSDKEIPTLLELLDDPKADAYYVVNLLAKIDSPSSVQGLLSALKHQDPQVKMCSALALGELGLFEAVPGLVKLLFECHFRAFDQISQIFQKFSVNNESVQAVPQLYKAGKLEQSDVVMNCISSIQNKCKYYNHNFIQTTQPNSNPSQPPVSIPTQITYDLRGANIGNWAENQYGIQQTTQIHPNPSQPPETPQ